MTRRAFSERHRQQRTKNYAVLVALVSFCAILYIVFIARAGLLG